MAHVSQLPCDGDGVCMLCKAKPAEEEKLTCKTCVTPWHAACLASPPENLAAMLQWECPDCSPLPDDLHVSEPVACLGPGGDLVARIREIEADSSLTEQEKARRRQALVGGIVGSDEDGKSQSNCKGKETEVDGESDLLNLFDGNFNCSFCMQMPERPVTTPCGHNFCLKCFQKWIGLGKRTCAKCRDTIPSKMASQPRINSTLVAAIRMAKISKKPVGGPSKVYHFVHNQERPNKAYTTDRAQRNGKANAASGRIFVTVPSDHFGPIPPENDPERNLGLMVGETWEGRLECRQWGAHFPPVAGIAGQSKHGAQSVVLSGGYQDDEDHGEWFLYTGSGGRDLSGNKRTNKNQSFDQKFEKLNEALRVSCREGYPVRVVRSYKEKRSSYAPEKGLRYDGIYRIEKCWQKVGIQGFKMCRYLFVRCDNSPAPWTSDEHGDQPRPLPVISELKNATNITERKRSPSWDFNKPGGCWMWFRSPPTSQKAVSAGNSDSMKRSRISVRQAQSMTISEKLLKEFSCIICKKVMTLPVTTPCAHNFCKSCLEGAFAGANFIQERNKGGRTLRSRKNVMKCPVCPSDISDYLRNPQVNRELMGVIETLKRKTQESGGGDDQVEESGDEETDCSEEVHNLTSGISKTPSVDSDETGTKDTSNNPLATSKTERSRKRMKIDVDGHLLSNNGLAGNSEGNKLFPGNPENVNGNVELPVMKCSSDREKADEEGGEEALGKGNDSPSSPLHLGSDGLDLKDVA